MIVVMNPRCSRDHVDHVLRLLDGMGVDANVIDGAERTILEVYTANGHVDRALLESAPMVDQLLDRGQPMLAAGRTEPQCQKRDGGCSPDGARPTSN